MSVLKEVDETWVLCLLCSSRRRRRRVQYNDGGADEGVMWVVWKSRVGREGLSQFPDPLLTDH